MRTEPWEQLGPGETWRGTSDLGFDGLPPLPVLAARGARSGPALVMTGGVHGDEYEGPAAIHALFRTLDASSLSGTVLGLPVVNVSAWEARSRVTPSDGVNLNRAFNQDGETLSHNLAGAVFDRFVRRCDALVDLHSGGVALDHLPLIGWYANGFGEAERIARRFGAALHPWIIPDVPGVLSCEAHRLGKIALGAEWRGSGRLDRTGAAAYADGLRRALFELEMMPRYVEDVESEPDSRRPIVGDYQRTGIGGLFEARVELGDAVTEGDLVGTIYDTLGTTLAEVRAERSGIVAGLASLAMLNEGDITAYIG